MRRSAVENSVDPTHYWCIPKREFCYKTIEFGQFGVPSEQDEIHEFERTAVYNLRLGLVSALEQIAVEYCLGGGQEHGDKK